jgi:hypothetical protein
MYEYIQHKGQPWVTGFVEREDIFAALRNGPVTKTFEGQALECLLNACYALVVDRQQYLPQSGYKDADRLRNVTTAFFLIVRQESRLHPEEVVPIEQSLQGSHRSPLSAQASLQTQRDLYDLLDCLYGELPERRRTHLLDKVTESCTRVIEGEQYTASEQPVV